MLNLTEQIPEIYGEVAFYWWTGEPLKKERLLWQLEQLKDHHICALQINYCHGDKGGLNYGLTMDSDPPVFSEEWWELVRWFLGECKKYGIAVALSDYTLSAPGQGKYMDAILEAHPEYIGKKLVFEHDQVSVREVEHSVNPMEPALGDAVLEAFFGQFEQHFPDEMGKGINFFFSDELVFNVSGTLWDDYFSEEFISRKGYAIEPYLRGLFTDIGPITQKIRLDYYDVIVSRMEEGYFKKVYEWNQSRGMIMGCDHGGRGRDVTEFGDYFRTQRWNQGPGNDQPDLASDLIKSKVSASIAHMYERPRVWLEGFYGSGWGTSSNELADAVFRNFGLGHNLLTLHGLYYTTYGGYWEWAPPCNHFRMPYWKHLKTFLSCTKTLSYLLSQGKHVCDAAILYPVAAMEGGIDGESAVEAAFSLAKVLYQNQIDFDFIDFQSVERAEIRNGRLCVSGEEFSVLIIPSMKTIRFSCIEQALHLQEQGGCPVLFGDLPIASDRAGREDEVLIKAVKQLQENNHPQTAEEVLSIIKAQGKPDFYAEVSDDSQVYFHHRKSEHHDLYFVYGLSKNTRCFFRSCGAVSLFDPWSRREQLLEVTEQTEEGTWLKAPLEQTEVQLFVFDRRTEHSLFSSVSEKQEQKMVLSGKWRFELLPTMENHFGDFRLPADRKVIGAEARYFRWNQGNIEKDIMYSVGTYFYLIGPVREADDQAVLNSGNLIPGMTVNCAGTDYEVKPYDFSMRFGVPGNAGYQHSYHGLKGYVSDAFITLGKKRVTQANSNSVYEKDADGHFYYLYTQVFCSAGKYVKISQGEQKADRVYLDNHPVTSEELYLEAGIHDLWLCYDEPGRTWFVFEECGKQDFVPHVLSMRWYRNPNILSFYPSMKNPSAGNFSFETPPACRSMQFSAIRKPDVFVNGEKVLCQKTGCDSFGITQYEIEIADPQPGCVPVCFHILADKEPGEAVITEPVAFVCGEGMAEAGDWGKQCGLAAYSGGVRYTKEVELAKCKSCVLDLGEVGCSAEVFVNGISAGIRMTAPYTFEIGTLIKPGNNIISAEIYNTLHNHYKTIPTQYNKVIQPSGLIGPAELRYQS